MQRIRLLDEHTINQIAAGEVIENAASVVKELVENALDAEASEVYIETKGGGRGEIKIIDNGIGMSSDDVLLSIERHATSKLQKSADLFALHTLGFRGEALPSIASISKMSLHSSPDVSGMGSTLSIEGGKIGSLTISPRQRGTTITVHSLFYNVPVRKSFQKSAASETAEIHKVLIKMALCHTSVKFRWIHDEKEQFCFEKDQGLLERMRHLLGQEICEKMLPIEQIGEEIELLGYLSHPSLHRPNRSGQYLYINGRPVVSPFVATKILEGYGTRLSTHRYPLFVLHLKVPPDAVDVNVHPQKKEVRLREEEKLSSFLMASVGKALTKRSEEIWVPPVAVSLSFPSFVSDQEVPYVAPITHQETVWKLPLVSNWEVLAKMGKYLIARNEEGLRLIDAERARGRIICEDLLTPKGKQSVQHLLIPIRLEFSGSEKLRLEEQLGALNKAGIGIRHFGGNTFLIDALPTCLESLEVQDVIYAFLEGMEVAKHLSLRLKRGVNSLEEGRVLVEKLFQCDNPEETPDGKKIYVSLNESMISKNVLP